MASVLDLPERLLPRCEGSESTAQLELMCAGKDYDCNDPYLLRLKERGEIILYDTRQCKTMSDRGEIFKKVCNFEDPETGGRVYISHGFFCEYVSVPSSLWLRAEARQGRTIGGSRESRGRNLSDSRN